ncbi:MAG: hypothetical protein INF44_02535 [Thalassospira sp.]|jgi:hypothetical protein|nr:hypothetical protein [Thalassospira sp.]
MNTYKDLSNTYADIGQRLRHIGKTNRPITSMHFVYDAIMHQAQQAAYDAERACIQLSRLLPNQYVDVQLYRQIIKAVILSNHKSNNFETAFAYICGVRDQLVREVFRLNGDLIQQREYRAMAA